MKIQTEKTEYSVLLANEKDRVLVTVKGNNTGYGHIEYAGTWTWASHIKNLEAVIEGIKTLQKQLSNNK